MKKNLNARRTSALDIRTRHITFWEKQANNKKTEEDRAEFEKMRARKIALAKKEVGILKERLG